MAPISTTPCSPPPSLLLGNPDARRLRVVVVDEELPYPANSGKRIRTLSLLLPLAARHDITYLGYRNVDNGETARAMDYLQSHGIETVVVDGVRPTGEGMRYYGRLLRNLLSPLPYSVQAHASSAMRRAVEECAKTRKVDLWQCEWTPYAQSVDGVVPQPWIIMAHNIESLIWQRYAENEPNLLKRWYIRGQWRKYERFERAVLGRACQTVTVSESDACWARDRLGASRLIVVDNGVDVARFAPAGANRDPRQIVFLGSLDWRHNLDAVLILLDRIFPLVRKQAPEARLVIVGRKPPDWLVARARAEECVELHADVPDVRPFLWQSGAMVVPLRVGGGSRIKIIESLAAECPVFSTAVGAEGLELDHGMHLYTADAPDALADALAWHIHNPQPAFQMAAAGRSVVAGRYDWAMLSEKLEAVWLAAASPSTKSISTAACP